MISNLIDRSGRKRARREASAKGSMSHIQIRKDFDHMSNPVVRLIGRSRAKHSPFSRLQSTLSGAFTSNVLYEADLKSTYFTEGSSDGTLLYLLRKHQSLEYEVSALSIDGFTDP